MNDNERKLGISGGPKERRDLAIPSEIQIEKDTANSEILVGSSSDGATEKRDAAALLLSVAAIASKEIRVDGLVWDDEDNHPTLVRPKARFALMTPFEKTTKCPKLTPRFAFAKHAAYDSDQDDDMEDLTLPPADDRFAWSRVRAVSMDSEGNRGSPEHSSHRKTTGNIVSPEHSPISRRPSASRKKGLRKKRKRSYSVESVDSSRPTKRVLPNDKHNGRTMQLILRKKFSWKNYPEVWWCEGLVCCIGVTIWLFGTIVLT